VVDTAFVAEVKLMLSGTSLIVDVYIGSHSETPQALRTEVIVYG